MGRTFAYLRVSTTDQSNDKFRQRILDYANDNRLGHVDFVMEKISGKKDWRKRKLGELIAEECSSGDIIITPELSRLARSIGQIYAIINECQERGITLRVIKQGIVISPQGMDIATKALISAFALVSEIERDFISIRTMEALEAARKGGKRLGRPKGSYSSSLDAHGERIMNLHREGVPATRIAKEFKVTAQTVRNWLKREKAIKSCL